MAMKGYSIFSKVSGLTIRWLCVMSRTLVGGSYLSAKKGSISIFYIPRLTGQLIDFNGMSTCLWLLYALRLENHIYISSFLLLFLKRFSHISSIPKRKKKIAVIWFQVFISNTKNFTQLSGFIYSKSIFIICTVVWFKELLSNTNNCMVLNDYFCFYVSKVKLAILVKGDPKVPFSIATTPRCRGGRYSITSIAPLHPWSFLYNADC